MTGCSIRATLFRATLVVALALPLYAGAGPADCFRDGSAAIIDGGPTVVENKGTAKWDDTPAAFPAPPRQTLRSHGPDFTPAYNEPLLDRLFTPAAPRAPPSIGSR